MPESEKEKEKKENQEKNGDGMIINRPEHKRTGSLFNELISLRKPELFEEDIFDDVNNSYSRKGSGGKQDEILKNLFFEPKLIYIHEVGKKSL